MNAGAYDGEMSHVVAETLCVDDKGRLIRLKGKSMPLATVKAGYKQMDWLFLR